VLLEEEEREQKANEVVTMEIETTKTNLNDD